MAPHLHRRTVLACLAACGAALATGARAAPAWPDAALRIIVPFAPGGGADASARVLAGQLAPLLGQAVAVQNMPGAGGTLGVLAAARARGGHTLLMGSNSLVINPALHPGIGYELARDFDPVGMVSAQPLVLVVPASSAVHSLADLVAQARAAPVPLRAGNSGAGTLAHIAAEIFARQAGVAIVPAPYPGESALLPDLLAGRVSFGFLNLPSVAAAILAGRLRALAVSAAEPLAMLPGVPTVRALGLPSLEVQGWAALLAPKDSIPRDGLVRLAALLAEVLASEQTRERLAALALTPVALDRAATARFLLFEAGRYAEVIRARGIKAR